MVNSPMQRMMNEICAQCLCVTHITRRPMSRVSYSPASIIISRRLMLILAILEARLGQKSLQEKIAGEWLRSLLDQDRDPVAVV